MHVIHKTHAPVLAGDVEVEGCDAEARADLRRDVGGEEGRVDATLREKGDAMTGWRGGVPVLLLPLA